MEDGIYLTFGIGVPLAVLAFLSYLKENSRGKNIKGPDGISKKWKRPISSNAR
ncbi:MAG: hypothetical protein WAM14_19175 [Candidatus Nitrosopolaris sp.]